MSFFFFFDTSNIYPVVQRGGRVRSITKEKMKIKIVDFYVS